MVLMEQVGERGQRLSKLQDERELWVAGEVLGWEERMGSWGSYNVIKDKACLAEENDFHIKTLKFDGVS